MSGKPQYSDPVVQERAVQLSAPLPGKPFEFNAAKMTLGFTCAPQLLAGTSRLAIGAGGRVELPL